MRPGTHAKARNAHGDTRKCTQCTRGHTQMHARAGAVAVPVGAGVPRAVLVIIDVLSVNAQVRILNRACQGSAAAGWQWAGVAIRVTRRAGVHTSTALLVVQG